MLKPLHVLNRMNRIPFISNQRNGIFFQQLPTWRCQRIMIGGIRNFSDGHPPPPHPHPQEQEKKKIFITDLKTFPDLLTFFNQSPSRTIGWNTLQEEEKLQLKEKIIKLDPTTLTSSVSSTSLVTPETYCHFFALCGSLPILWEWIPKETQQNLLLEMNQLENKLYSIPLHDWIQLVKGIHQLNESFFPNFQNNFIRFPNVSLENFYKTILKHILIEYYSSNHPTKQLQQLPASQEEVTLFEVLLSQFSQRKHGKELFTKKEREHLLYGVELYLLTLPPTRMVKVLRSLRILKFRYPIDFEKTKWDTMMTQLMDKIACESDPHLFDDLLTELAGLHYTWVDMPFQVRYRVLQSIESLFTSSKKDPTNGDAQMLLPEEITKRMKTLGDLHLPWIDIPPILQNHLDQSFEQSILHEHHLHRVKIGKKLVEMGLQWDHPQFPTLTKKTYQIQFFRILTNKENRKQFDDYLSYLAVFKLLQFDWTKDVKVKAVILNYLNNFVEDDDKIITSVSPADSLPTPSLPLSSSSTTKISGNNQNMRLLSLLIQLVGDQNISCEEIPLRFQQYTNQLIHQYLQQPKTDDGILRKLLYGLMGVKHISSDFKEILIPLTLHFLERNPLTDLSKIFSKVTKIIPWEQFTNNQRHDLAKVISKHLERIIQEPAFPVIESFSQIVETLTLLTFDSISSDAFEQLYPNEQQLITQEIVTLHLPLLQFYLFFIEPKRLHRTKKNLEKKKIAIYFDWLSTLPLSLQGSLLQPIGRTEFPLIKIDLKESDKSQELVLKEHLEPLIEELKIILTAFLMKENVKEGHNAEVQDSKTAEDVEEKKVEVEGSSSLSKKQMKKKKQQDGKQRQSFSIIPNYHGLTSNTFPMTIAIKLNKKLAVFLEFVEYENETEGIPKREYLLMEYFYHIYFSKIPGIRFTIEDLKSPETRKEMIHQVQAILSPPSSVESFSPLSVAVEQPAEDTPHAE